MSRSLLIAAFLFSALRSLLAQEEPGEDTSAGLPTEYADYLIASSTLSADKAFAVIYPKTDLCADEPKKGAANRCKDYLVALRPFHILTTLETKYPQFQNKNHGGISASWSGDSALITLDSKWGPGDVFLCEIHDGKVSRSTNLLPKVRDLFVPDYTAAKMGGSAKDEAAFLIESPEEGAFAEFADATHVRIHANATTDPKETPGRKAWEAAVEAMWDIPQSRFTSEKVKRTFAGVRKAQD